MNNLSSIERLRNNGGIIMGINTAAFINLVKRHVPDAIQFCDEQKINTSEGLLSVCNKIFRSAEESVDEKASKPFTTISCEDQIISDLQALAKWILKNISINNNTNEYRKLMSRRYFAYIVLTEIDNIDKYIESNEILIKTLYLGLVDFFKNRYDCFATNEEAIKMICIKYPQNISDNDFNEKEKDEIASVLYKHVSLAGTPNDIGYAFNGISLIEENIKCIPEDILLIMLKKYSLYDIVTREVIRHQVCAVIINSQLEEKIEHYKFFFLDSLLIADTINKMWDRENKNWEKNYSSIHTLMEKTEFEVFKNPKVYWENEIEKTVRVCHVGTEQLEIARHGEIIEVSYDKNSTKFEFRKERWLLDEYASRETQEKLSTLLFSKTLAPGNRLLFSLAYFENYRGVTQQNIELDHHYSFINENNKKRLRKNDNVGIDHFYGKNIYSMTCIVGKNGTGKSSIVDFLRNTFFDLLERIHNSEEPICEQGIVNRDELINNKILDKDTDFFIVFNMGNLDYYLTNMKDIIIEEKDIYPYDDNMYSSLDELSKVVYFSQQIRGEQIAALKTDNSLKNDNDNEWLVNMSEENMMIRRINADSANAEKTGYINSDLCYQFAMLRYMDSAQICKYLDIDKDYNFRVFGNKNKEESKNKEEAVAELRTSDLNDDEKRSEIQKRVINNPKAYIGALSAGQYAKFSFMARLFWYLEGCRKEKKYYKEYLKLENAIYKKEILNEGEAVVIFIDEGELYYHPEWQRKYLSMIFDMIQNVHYDVKIQLIITTNSPFMISDVLQDDVQYLMEDEKKKNSQKTLGQNIHTLLKENFFMDFTIGEYSHKLINEVVELLLNIGKNNEGDTNYENNEQDSESSIEKWLERFYYSENKLSTYEKMLLLINQIGEPVYKQKLTQLLEQKFKKSNSVEERIRQLELQREQIENKIKLLNEEAKDNGKNR